MIFRFLLCFLFLEFYGIYARTDQEIKEWFFQEGIGCNRDNPITPEEIIMLKERKMPDSKNAKCLVACIFKKTGMFNSSGMFDADASLALSEKDHADDPKKQEDAKKLMEACKKVNSEPVTDGDSGCDRAVLLHKCFIDTAAQLGIQLP